MRYQIQDTEGGEARILDTKRSRYLKKPQGSDLFTRQEAIKLVDRKNSRYQSIRFRKNEK